MPKNSLFPFNRNEHDENPFKKKWIVIRKEMCMTKTIQKEMDSHSCRNVYDKNPFQKEMDSHLYGNVHDENPFKKI